MSVRVESAVTSYYRAIVPVLDRLFGPIPVVATSFPPEGDGAPRRHRAVPLTKKSLLWLCQHDGAVEFQSWTPTAADPTRVRFARILLAATGDDSPTALSCALHELRELVEETRVVGIPLLAGAAESALWIPFGDGPEYPPVRAWLRAICDEAVRRRPRLFTAERNSHARGRVRVDVATNGAGRGSALPYTLIGAAAEHVCLPLQWSEVGRMGSDDARRERVAARLEIAGDVFETQAERLAGQRFVQARPVVPLLFASAPVPKAAPAQPAQREEDDPWPALAEIEQPSQAPDARALAERLAAAADGTDRAAFGIAICDAFAHLGFVATHANGEGVDGTIEAPLGPLGYRFAFTCEPNGTFVARCDAWQSVWTVSDLVALLHSGANPHEIEPAFAGTRAADAVATLLWKRRHGAAKRVGAVCTFLRERGTGAIDEPAAVALVDEQLAQLGSTATCSLDDVRCAFAYLTNPLVGAAVWADTARTAIVVVAR